MKAVISQMIPLACCAAGALLSLPEGQSEGVGMVSFQIKLEFEVRGITQT